MGKAVQEMPIAATATEKEGLLGNKNQFSYASGGVTNVAYK